MRPPRAATVVLLGAACLAGVFLTRAALLLHEMHLGGAAGRDLLRPAAVVAGLVLLAAGLVAATRVRPPLRANLALSASAAIATLYGVEAALLLASPEGARLREKLAVLQAMRARGVDPSPGVEPVRFVWLHRPGSPEWLLLDGRPTLPLGGISSRRTVDCKEGGDWLVYDTDERGFHNPTGSWSATSLEVAFVGDSFVHGSCVPSEANMVALVRRRHPATLNLGTAGAGPLIELAQLREYLTVLKPRAVVWAHYSGNDLLDLRRERGHPLLARYLEEGHRQGLDAALQPALDRELEGYVQTTLLPDVRRGSQRRVPLRPLLALRRIRAAAGLGVAAPYRLGPTEDEFALFARVLTEARRTVEGWGGRFLFVYLPTWNPPARQLGEAAYRRTQEATARRTRAIVAQLGLALVDVEARFAAHPDPASLYACPGCHYGPAGYALAAEAILETLERGGP